MPAHMALEIILDAASHEVVCLLFASETVEREAFHGKRLCRHRSTVSVQISTEAREAKRSAPPCSGNFFRIVSDDFRPFLYCFVS